MTITNIPAFRVTIDGKDVTERMRPRLIGLSISERRGDEADQLDLMLDDSDGLLALPRIGAEIRVEIGWLRGSGVTPGLINKGMFKVDEVEHGGPPDMVTVRARSADFTGGLKTRRETSWRDTTLGAVLNEIAGRNGLAPHISASLAARAVSLITQSRESDVALLKRLGREYDAVATIKNRALIFSGMGEGRTVTGKTIPPVTIRRSDGERHSYTLEKRDEYSGVTATWHSTAQAQRRKVTVGTDTNAKTLRRVYASEADARRAAEAEWGRLRRGPAKFAFNLALGRPELYPERKVSVTGFKREIDATSWLITELTHSLDQNGLTTDIRMETAA